MDIIRPSPPQCRRTMYENNVDMSTLLEITLDTSFTDEESAGEHGDSPDMDSCRKKHKKKLNSNNVVDTKGPSSGGNTQFKYVEHSGKLSNKQSKIKLKVCDRQNIKHSRPNSAKSKASYVHNISHPSNPFITYGKLKEMKLKVDKAIREQKIFYVSGQFPSVCEALIQRGWIHKIQYHRRQASKSIPTAHDNATQSPRPASKMKRSSFHLVESENMFTSRLLQNINVNFMWANMSEPWKWNDINKEMIVSRLPRPLFTSKVGLCSFLQQMHWFCEDGVSDTLFPRCYNICQLDERLAFINDFRITACLGLLKWLVIKYESQDESYIKSSEGKIPLTAVQFALKQCCEYISLQTHEDIDKDVSSSCVWDHQWDQFLTWYYMIVHKEGRLLEAKDPPLKMLYTSAKSTLLNMKKYWPQMNMDGYLNIWIFKPGNSCRGQGIKLMNRLEDVLAKLTPMFMKNNRYVIQKYIERPLLVYNTKFDIRQWFLVTSTHPLIIWMYKECYLRFCSQPFDLHNFHEAVHLCNNAVQVRYENGKRAAELPDENMWDNYTFKTYLRKIGHADQWDKTIYPGMCKGIVGSLLASQESMIERKNSFELFGADFMLTEEFQPYLIEINRGPAMSATTSVTARMCTQCLEDVIKVIIDRRHNKIAQTGMFELVYQQQISPTPAYLGMTLSISGKKISYCKCKYKASVPFFKATKPQIKTLIPKAPMYKEMMKTPINYIGPIIVDLISELSPQLDKTTNQRMLHMLTERDMDNNQKEIKEINSSKESGKEKSPNSESTPVKHAATRASTTEDSEDISMKAEEEEENINPNCEKERNHCIGDDSLKKNITFNMWHDVTESKDSLYDSCDGINKILCDEFIPKSKKKCNGWKNSSDAMKSIELFNEWKQKLDHTRATCEDMLAKLKVFRENDHLSPKSKISSIDKSINWEGESINKPTISDIIKKLSQTQPEREVFMSNKRREFMEPLPEPIFSESRERIRSKPSYLNVLTEDDGQSKAKRSGTLSPHRLPITPHIYNPVIDKSITLSPAKGMLPHIKQKNQTSIAGVNVRKPDSFYAIGMSLKTLKVGLNQKEHLLLPLGSDHCLEMNSTLADSMGMAGLL